MRVFPQDQYFTRRQSDSRFVWRPQPAPPPVGLTFIGTGLSTDNPGYAYIDVDVTDPATPYWAVTGQYVTDYEFHCLGTLAGSFPTSLIVRVPWSAAGGPYRIEPLIYGVTYTITARTVDYISQVSVDNATALVETAASSGVAPPVPALVLTPVPTGCMVELSAIDTDPAFSNYELWRGEGYTGSSWSVNPTKLMTFTAQQLLTYGGVLDHAIPITASDYYYYVKLFNLDGSSSQTSVTGPVSLTSTGHAAPPEPDLVGPPATSAASNADGTITFTWKANTSDTSPNLAGYRVHRRIHGTTSWLLLNDLSAAPAAPGSGAIFSYVDTETFPGYTYDYSASAYDIYGNESDFDVTHDPSATSTETDYPDAPANLTFVGVLGGISASWTAVGTAVGYEYSYRYAEVGDPSLTSWSSPEQTPSNSVTLYGLIYPTTGGAPTRDLLANQFQVRVRTYDEFSHYSPYLLAIITYPELAGYQPADTSVPPSPLEIDPVINNDSSILLTWPAPTIDDLLGYQIESIVNDTGDWTLLAQLRDNNPGTRQFLATGLEPYTFTNKQYRFRVRTQDTSGNLSSYNELLNPGFETGDLTSWTPTGVGVATVINTNTEGGSSFALKQNYTGRVSQVVAATAGDNYIFSAGVTDDPSSPGCMARISISWLNISSGVISSFISPATLTDGNYQRIVFSQVAPTGTVSVQLTLLSDPNTPSKTAIWDDTQFEQSFVVTAYGDGKTGLLRSVDTAGPQDYWVSGGGDPLKFTGVGALGQNNLHWYNPARSFSGYYDWINAVMEIWRKVTITGVGGPPVDSVFRKIDEVAVTADGAQVGYSDLEPPEDINVTAQYMIRGRDRFGNIGPYIDNGQYVQVMSLTPDDLNIVTNSGTPPPVPVLTNSGEGAFPQGDASILVKWTAETVTDDPQLAGYNIMRRITGTSTWTIAGTLMIGPQTGLLTWSDGSVVLGTSYDYSVAAFDTNGNLSLFDTIHFFTAISGDSIPQPIPTLTSLGGYGCILLNWAPSPTIGVTSYQVSYSLDSGVTYGTPAVCSGTSFQIGFNHGESSAYLQTNFVVRIGALSLTGLHMSTYFFRTLGSVSMSGFVPVDINTPSPPTSLAGISNGQSQVVLTWTDSPTTDVVSYLLQAAPVGTSSWVYVADIPPGTGAYTVNGFQPTIISGINWVFSLMARNVSNLLSTAVTSNTITVFAPATPPSTPTGLAGNMINDSGLSTATATISWNENPEINIRSYNLTFQKSSGDGVPGTLHSPYGSPFQTVLGLQQGVNYNFSVSAVDIYGNQSSYCSPITVMSAAGGGSTPATPTITAAYDATHDWDIVTVVGYTRPPGFTNYEIYRNPTSGQGPLIASPSTDIYDDTGVFQQITGQDFYYSAKAVAGGVKSALSNIAHVNIPGSGGSGGDGGLGCVTTLMYLREDLQAYNVSEGDVLDCMSDFRQLLRRPVLAHDFLEEECVRLKSANGAELECSVSTPFTLWDGKTKYSPDMGGRLVATDIHGKTEWVLCTSCEPIGKRMVVKISLGGISFASGVDPYKRIYSHNVRKG